MSEATVAKRYAEALFQLGSEKSTLDQLVKELSVVREVFQSNEQLITFLNHPRIKSGEKKAVLQESFKGLSEDGLNTIQLLVDRHRIEIISSVVDHFIHMVNEVNGIVEATVYSVRDLSKKELKGLESTFAKRLNKQAITFNNIVDPSLIGGLRIRVGNTIYDGSVSSKLKQIEHSITKVNN